MNINKINQTRITFTKVELENHISRAFADIINDNADDPYMMQTECQRYSDIIDAIENYRIKNFFEEGFTMVLLPGKAFDEVERFFDTRKPFDGQELIIEITHNGKVVETIHEDYLKY